MKKLLMILAVLCLAAAGGSGEGGIPAESGNPVTAEITEKSLELGGSRMAFPAVAGMEDAALEAQVNTQIQADLHVNEYLARMTALISDEQRSVTAGWAGGIAGGIFSAVLEAEGSVNPPRVTHAWTWSNIDLRDGHEITLGELFTDEAAAREALEEYLEYTVAPEMSPHLGNSGLTPLPEGFRLERTGLTLLYDAGQLSTLSDRAGAVKISWNEIRAFADWSEDGILSRIGAAEAVTLTGESRERLRETAAGGQLPDIPVKIGDSVKEWTDKARLLNDPEEYAGGRMFALEGAPFRDVYLLSDAVDSGWDNSRVRGIRMDRGCLWGLCIGETAAADWHMLLGEPDETAVLDAEAAADYRTVPGTCDYYLYGSRRLQLMYGEDGILAGITLAE